MFKAPTFEEYKQIASHARTVPLSLGKYQYEVAIDRLCSYAHLRTWALSVAREIFLKVYPCFISWRQVDIVTEELLAAHKAVFGNTEEHKKLENHQAIEAKVRDDKKRQELDEARRSYYKLMAWAEKQPQSTLELEAEASSTTQMPKTPPGSLFVTESSPSTVTDDEVSEDEGFQAPSTTPMPVTQFGGRSAIQRTSSTIVPTTPSGKRAFNAVRFSDRRASLAETRNRGRSLVQVKAHQRQPPVSSAPITPPKTPSTTLAPSQKRHRAEIDVEASPKRARLTEATEIAELQAQVQRLISRHDLLVHSHQTLQHDFDQLGVRNEKLEQEFDSVRLKQDAMAEDHLRLKRKHEAVCKRLQVVGGLGLLD